MAARLTRILVFARAPVAGAAKTRLIPALGADGAARLARTMLAHALLEAAAAEVGPVELVGDPHPGEWDQPVEGLAISAQHGADLGERIANAVEPRLALGEQALVTGTDCPALVSARIAEAARALDNHDIAIIPATDGGYVLIGFARFDRRIFEAVEWGTATVVAATRDRIAELGWTLWLGDPLADIDHPADLKFVPSPWLAGLER